MSGPSAVSLQNNQQSPKAFPPRETRHRGIVKCCGWQESASQRFQAASFISPSMNGTPSMTWVMSL